MSTSPGRPNPAAGAVMALLAGERHGVLCTAHARHEGWPFGSIVPFALLASGDPVVLLSSIAEHTKNLLTEPRGTLFVHDTKSGGDPQALPRAALLFRARVLEGPAAEAAFDAYLARFPNARATMAHDSLVIALEVVRVRWIAGFGSMGWIDRESLGSA